MIASSRSSHNSAPNAPPTMAFTALEINVLDQLTHGRATHTSKQRLLSDYLIRVAKLGGYLARAAIPLQATSSSGQACLR